MSLDNEHLNRSPCLTCERRNQDKNSSECLNCKQRIAYSESLDPAGLVKRHFAFSSAMHDGKEAYPPKMEIPTIEIGILPKSKPKKKKTKTAKMKKSAKLEKVEKSTLLPTPAQIEIVKGAACKAVGIGRAEIDVDGRGIKAVSFARALIIHAVVERWPQFPKIKIAQSLGVSNNTIHWYLQRKPPAVELDLSALESVVTVQAETKKQVPAGDGDRVVYQVTFKDLQKLHGRIESMETGLQNILENFEGRSDVWLRGRLEELLNDNR